MTALIPPPFQPGDRVHVTVEAVVDERGVYEINHELRAYATWLEADTPAILTVTKAPTPLPAGFGARIRATVQGQRCVLVNAHPTIKSRWLAAPGTVRDPSQRFDDDALTDVEVLDPGEPTEAPT